MAFNPLREPGMTEQQDALYKQIHQHLSCFSSDVPHLKRKLATKNELRLYKHINENFENIIISMQVQLLRIVNVDVDSLQQEWEQNGCPAPGYGDLSLFFSSIDKLSLDFVISNNEGDVLLAIELDGPEHDIDSAVLKQWVRESSAGEKWNGKTLTVMPARVKAWYRDRFKQYALLNAGVNFLRIKNEEVSEGASMFNLTCKLNKYLK